MRLYHGSNAIFSKFDQGKARIANDFYGAGVAYFTDNIEIAKTYAKAMNRVKGGDLIIYEVELTLKKMFDVDHEFTGHELMKFYTKKTVEDFARGARLLPYGVDKYTVIAKLLSGNMILTGDDIFRGLSRGMVETAKARDFLIKLGYDGLRHNGGVTSMNTAIRHNVYLAYKANEITITKRYRIKPKEPDKLVTENVLTIKSTIREQLKKDRFL